MVIGAQEVSAKRESGTIGQLLGGYEINAGWPYQLATKMNLSSHIFKKVACSL